MSKEKQEIIFYLFIPLHLIPPPASTPDLRVLHLPLGTGSLRAGRLLPHARGVCPGPGTPGMWTVATPGARTHDLLSVKQTC